MKTPPLPATRDDSGGADKCELLPAGLERGHALEDLAISWLRAAGIDLYTRKGNRPDGDQFGFSVAGGRIRGHVDGIIASVPSALGLAVPALWECKTMNAKNWRETVAKVQLANREQASGVMARVSELARRSAHGRAG